MMQKYLILLILFLIFISKITWANSLQFFEPITLYSQSSGPWNTPHLWNTAPNGSGTSFTDPNNTIGPSGPEFHIIIQAGHEIILNDTKGIHSIHVEGGGKIYRNTSSNRYLEIYGNEVRVDGIMGNQGIYDGLGLEMQTPQCNLLGNGNVRISRIRKQAFVDTQLNILMNVTLDYNGGALYNDIEGYAFNINIPSGVEVKITSGDLSIDGVDGTNNSHRWGNYVINGTLEVGGDFYVTTDNPGNHQNITYAIGSSGHVIVHGTVIGNSGVSGAATAILQMASGARLTVDGPGEVFQEIDGIRNQFIFQNNSEVNYASSSIQFIEDELLYAKLAINGGSDKILEGQVLVNEMLLLNNGYPILGDHNLIINPGGFISGGSVSSYIKSTNTGRLVQQVGQYQVPFPLGVFDYTPIQLYNAGTEDLYALRAMEQVYDNGFTGNLISSSFVNTTWFLEEFNAGGSNLNISVEWPANNELPLFDRSNCYVSHYLFDWDSPSASNASGFGPFQQSRSNLTEMGPITVGSGVQLPIELSDFTGHVEAQGIRLNWQTTSETNNEWFVIEKTNGLAPFTAIDRIYGAGNSSSTLNYTYLDVNPSIGPNYYRIKQVDFDGQYSYSPIILVEFERTENAEIRLWPNPASDFIQIEWQGQEILEDATVHLINANGQVLHSYIGSEIGGPINISHLEEGLYNLLILSPGNRKVKQFMKD